MNPVVEELAEALKEGGHLLPEKADLLVQVSGLLGAELGNLLGKQISALESRMDNRMAQFETEMLQALDNVSTKTAENVAEILDGFHCPMIRKGVSSQEASSPGR